MILNIANQSGENGLILEPTLIQNIVSSINNATEKLQNENKKPVLITAPAIRKDISLMLRQHIDNIDVLSFTELPDDKKIDVIATISLDQEDKIRLNYGEIKMTQHKVLSDDSMTAMDEIARVLGQDAVILSTKKIGEKIEIIGSNDIKDILKSNKKNNKKPNFQELFSKVPLSKNHTNININPIVKNDSNDKSAINQKFVSKIDLENFKHEIKSILNTKYYY